MIFVLCNVGCGDQEIQTYLGKKVDMDWLFFYILFWCFSGIQIDGSDLKS